MSLSYEEKYKTDREKILNIVLRSKLPLDYVDIARSFKMKYRYLPSVERRLRELVKKEYKTMNNDK